MAIEKGMVHTIQKELQTQNTSIHSNYLKKKERETKKNMLVANNDWILYIQFYSPIWESSTYY